MDYYVKSVIPVIESNYENFTALEKNIADFFMKNEETYENSKVRIINPLSAEYLLENSKIIVLDHQYIRDAIKTDYMYKWTPATPVFITI